MAYIVMEPQRQSPPTRTHLTLYLSIQHYNRRCLNPKAPLRQPPSPTNPDIFVSPTRHFRHLITKKGLKYTSTPVSVTRNVCSYCAERLPSFVVAAQSSGLQTVFFSPRRSGPTVPGCLMCHGASTCGDVVRSRRRSSPTVPTAVASLAMYWHTCRYLCVCLLHVYVRHTVVRCCQASGNSEY